MMNIINFKLHKAVFISEGKNRFICNILYEDQILECYVPITCKLSRLISLEYKEILIKETTKVAKRTKYTLFAVQNEKNYLIVDTGFANHIVKAILAKTKKGDLFYPEQVIENYKCDFYSKTSKTLVEVKSVITEKETIVLPNIETNRTCRQLKILCSLLSQGYKAMFFVVSFAPKVKEIHFNTKQEMGQSLFTLIKNGGQIYCIRVNLTSTYKIKFEEIPYTFI